MMQVHSDDDNRPDWERLSVLMWCIKLCGRMDSKELYELMKQFEKDCDMAPGYMPRIAYVQWLELGSLLQLEHWLLKIN